MTAFDDALKITLKWEGGYSDNSHDPGGETRFGISKRAYPDLDIENLTEDEAREIYRRDYWDAVSGDLLPPGVSTVVFDCAVNLGPNRAVKFLQLAVGAKADGVIGPLTLAAIAGKPRHELMAEISARRALHHADNGNGQFMWGWLRRTCHVLAEAS